MSWLELVRTAGPILNTLGCYPACLGEELFQGSHSPGKSGNFVGGQGILVARERKWRFLSMFQRKVATR